MRAVYGDISPKHSETRLQMPAQKLPEFVAQLPRFRSIPMGFMHNQGFVFQTVSKNKGEIVLMLHFQAKFR